MYALEFGRDFTGHQDPRQVAHVEAIMGPPIDQHQIAFADPAIGGCGMWQRRSRSDGNNRSKAAALAAKDPDLLLQLASDLAFCLVRTQ